MIRPFRILETRTEADGAVGVIYEVWRHTAVTAYATDEERMRAYMPIPDGAEAEAYLFDQLSLAGWIL